MNCWHASARMLYGYRNSACINPLPQSYKDNTGIGAEEFISLARDIGLDTLPQVNQSFSWRFIDDNLRALGPIWAAGNGTAQIILSLSRVSMKTVRSMSMIRHSARRLFETWRGSTRELTKMFPSR